MTLFTMYLTSVYISFFLSACWSEAELIKIFRSSIWYFGNLVAMRPYVADRFLSNEEGAG